VVHLEEGKDFLVEALNPGEVEDYQGEVEAV
jgi:hypothetical protein